MAWSGLKDIGSALGILDSPYSIVFSQQHNELIGAEYEYCK